MIFEKYSYSIHLEYPPNKRVKQSVYDREDNKIDTNYYCK